ncbi:MAG: HAD family phosphatase [Deltaproteobacteria bacterium]|nr:HAD family phosphatase [Deltaproteobacteria bacterium]
MINSKKAAIETNRIQTTNIKPCTVEIVFFDFGGVLAEEGYRDGLIAIAKLNNINPQQFLKTAVDVTFKEGFVTGRIDEKTFWQTLREQTNINGSDEEFRNEVLSRFELRPWMMNWIKKLKKFHIRLAILSDQTKWLDELDMKYGFFQWFDGVFNSYHIGKCKREPAIFDYVLAEMNIKPDQALFVDDNQGNIQRANEKGLHTIHYQNRKDFERELLLFYPFLKDS